MLLQTAFTARFGSRLPIVLAPMAGASGGRLAAAVARAGGFPFIAGGHAGNMAELEQEIQLFKELAPTDTKWGLGLISYSALGINKVLIRYDHLCVFFLFVANQNTSLYQSFSL